MEAGATSVCVEQREVSYQILSKLFETLSVESPTDTTLAQTAASQSPSLVLSFDGAIEQTVPQARASALYAKDGDSSKMVD